MVQPGHDPKTFSLVYVTDAQLVHLGPRLVSFISTHLRPMAESRVPDDGRCVYVGNVAKYAEWQELKDYMRPGSGKFVDPWEGFGEIRSFGYL